MKAIVETAASLLSRPTSVTSTCRTKLDRPWRTIQASARAGPTRDGRQEMDVHVRGRRAEAVLVIARVIGQTSGADVDEHRNEASLQRAADIRDLGADVHLNHEMTLRGRHVACPELLEEVSALCDHLVVQL